MEEDRQRKLQEKLQANHEMVHELHHIDSAKKEAWNKQHKDETNKQKTLELLAEQERLRNEAKQMYNEQKDYLKSSLL